jgi:HEPN domain-containing protein
MAIIPSSATSRQGGRWLPRWLRREREDRELARWTTELGWQWLDAVDSAQLARHSVTAGRIPLTVAPQMHSVDVGPPVTLLVEMLPGQVVEDFENKADRLAAGMGVSKVYIEPYDTGWIRVVLLDDDHAYTDVPVPA